MTDMNDLLGSYEQITEDQVENADMNHERSLTNAFVNIK